MARWLATRVGPHGRVVATDIDTQPLGDGLPANLAVRRHDILADPVVAGQYDLVHCRAVLTYLQDPARAVASISSGVRPGGWLVLEDVDCGSFGAV